MRKTALNYVRPTTEAFEIDPIRLAIDLRRTGGDALLADAQVGAQASRIEMIGSNKRRNSVVLNCLSEWIGALTQQIPGAVSHTVRARVETLRRNAMSTRHRGLRQQLKGARGRVVDVLNPLGISNGRG